MASSPITCFACGGSYTADQRRRHEQTAKHQDAIRPAVEANVAKQNGEPVVDTIDYTGAVATVLEHKAAKYPAEAATIAALEKAVKSRAADVRWSENPKHGDSAKKLEARRTRLAEAQNDLALALVGLDN